MSNIINRKIAVRFGTVVGEISIKIWQAEENAPVLFCLPGYVGHIGSEFSFLASHLSENGYTVVVPDVIGRGDSTFFGEKEYYSPKNTLISLHAIFSAFPGRPRFVMGTSWGGVMALMYMQAFRENFSGVIFNDIPLINYGPSEDFKTSMLELCKSDFETLEEAASFGHATLDRVLGPLPRHFDAEFVGANYVGERDGRFRFKVDPALVEIIEEHIFNRFDISGDIAALQCPVALLYGTNSWHRDMAVIELVRRNGRDVTVFDNLAGTHPPQMLTRDQHMVVQGFLDYATKKVQPWRQGAEA